MATKLSLSAFRIVGNHVCRIAESISHSRSASRLVPHKKFGGNIKDRKHDSLNRRAQLATREVCTAQAAIQYEAPPMSVAAHTVQAVTVDQRREMLITQWSDGTQAEFPFLWLRDNCQCSSCFHKSAIQRLFVMENLNVNVQPTDVQYSQDKIHIMWSDGHSGSFDSSWLHKHQFTKAAQKERSKWLPRKPVHWGAEMQDNIPSGSYDEVRISMVQSKARSRAKMMCAYIMAIYLS